MQQPYAPLNPMWAQGFSQRTGRPATQQDWEAYQEHLRRGGKPEETTADMVAPYAPILGSAAGMYASSYIPQAFDAIKGAVMPQAATQVAQVAAPQAVAPVAQVAAPQIATQAVNSASAVPVGTNTVLAPTATAPTMSGTIGAVAPYAIPAIGAALIGNGVYNMFKGDKTAGLLDWASRASLGVATGGISEILRGFGLFDKPRTQVEESRWKDLADEGFTLPDWVANGIDINEQGAGARRDLAADFIGLAPTAGEAVGIGATPVGSWVNNKFAESRDVADLRAKDIWGYAALPEMFGKDYMTTSEANREAIAAKALELGLVSEGKGTIDIQDDSALRDYWASLITPKDDGQELADVVNKTVARLYGGK